METTQIEILLGAIALFANSLLGVIVFNRDRGSWTHRIFFILSLLIDAYVVVNYLSLHPPFETPDSQLFWIRMVMFVTSLIGPTVFLLAHTFPGSRLVLRRRYVIALLVLMTASAVASLLPLVFSSIQYPGGKPLPVPGPGIPIFILDFVGMFILSFAVLIYGYRKSSGLDKIRNKIFLLGMTATFSLMGLTTVIFVVILKTSALVFLGPIYPVILMACIAYAIVKYQLFNVKVIATEALVVAIWISLFGRTIIEQDLLQKIVGFALLTGITLLSNILVQSVRNEVRQREQLEELTKTLEIANEKLKALDQARSDFITIASHQLRTPPATIKWYLSALLSGDYGPVPPEIKIELEKTQVTTNGLIALVDDMLNASRIERGKMEFLFEPTNIEEITRLTVEQLLPLATMKKLQLTYHKPIATLPPVMADKEKLRQVINNFIDNSIKYTPAGAINVDLKQVDDAIVVSVTDTGKGIAASEAGTLFEKYNRGKDSVTHAAGLGLGLYVAKIVVEQHKGKIWAASPGPGKGSTFSFSIPIHNDLEATTLLDLAPNPITAKQ